MPHPVIHHLPQLDPSWGMKPVSPLKFVVMPNRHHPSPASETSKDASMLKLKEAIPNGVPDACRLDDDIDIATCWRYRHGLYELDGLIVYNDRVAIPPSLRHAMLYALHSAHQGASSMGARARNILFCPGMTADIERVRQSCHDWIKNSPLQTQLPSVESPPPSTPFHMIHADFFDCIGQHYMFVGDRLAPRNQAQRA